MYPSAPLEKSIDLEQRLEKNSLMLTVVINHISNIREMIMYFTDKNNKSKQKYKKLKTLTTILKSFDKYVFIATTSSSFTLSLTGIN